MIKDEVIQLVLEFTYKYISPKEADQILAIFKRQIEELENPYSTHVHLDAGVYDGLYRKVYDRCKQDILSKLFGR